MKKIMALMIVGIFLISIIPVSASSSLSEKDKKIVEEYNQLKKEHNTVKEQWKKARSKYVGAKQSYKKFGQLTIDEQNDKFGIAQDFLLKTLDRMDGHLRLLQKWAERVIEDEELQNEVIIELEEYSTQINIFKDEVESTENIKELRKVGKEIKNYWKSTREKLKRIVGIILSERTNNVIKRAERLSGKLHEKIDALDQNNKEVSEMQDLLNDLDEKIKLAKEDYEKAKELYQQIQSLQDADQLFKQIKEYLEHAHKYLKESHKKLRELVKLYRQHVGNFPEIEASLIAPE
jgi:uncharacterized protein YoxC